MNIPILSWIGNKDASLFSPHKQIHSCDIPGRAVTVVALSAILFCICPPVHDKIKKG